MSSITQPVPEKEALLIEYPGFVKNPDAVIETLGGLEAVSAIAVGSTPLPLRLRPGDPLSHPLEGNKQPTCGLLLRICRKAGAGDDAEESMRAEIVAHVKSAVRFVGMADFQYVSHDSRPLHEHAPQPEGPPGLDAEPMLIPPTHFTRVDMPLDYAFRSYYSGDPDYMKTGARVGRSIGRLATHVINFQAVNVLPPLSDPGAEVAGLYKDRKVILRDFSALLAQRPIWSSSGLRERVTGFTAAEFDIMLPRVAYMFRNGPWKGLWIRRGYDPRTDPTSHKHQTVEYRGVERSAALGEAVPVGPSHEEVTRFAALPVATCPLQLCDLADVHIQTIIQKPAQLTSCNMKTGWFSAEVWHELRARINARFAALSPAAPSASRAATAEAGRAGEAGGEPGRPTAVVSDEAVLQQNSADAPQQQAGASASAAQLSAPRPPAHAQTAEAVGVFTVQPAGQHAEPEAGDASRPADDNSREGDVRKAADDISMGEGGPCQSELNILPAMYLQSVLDSWQAEEPTAQVAPRAAELLGAAGEDPGDFEIFEGSEDGDEADAGDLNAEAVDADEGAETNDEAGESDNESEDEGQGVTDEEGGDAEGEDSDDDADEEEYQDDGMEEEYYEDE